MGGGLLGTHPGSPRKAQMPGSCAVMGGGGGGVAWVNPPPPHFEHWLDPIHNGWTAVGCLPL